MSCLVLIWYSLYELSSNSNEEWGTCAKPEKTLGTRLRNAETLQVEDILMKDFDGKVKFVIFVVSMET